MHVLPDKNNHSAKQTQCEKAVQNKNKNKLDSEGTEGTRYYFNNTKLSFLHLLIFHSISRM